MKLHPHIFLCIILFPLMLSCGNRNDFESLLQSGIECFEAGDMESAMRYFTDAEDHMSTDVSSDKRGLIYLYRGAYITVYS